MYIVWGKKIVRRKRGYVVDFCPICRELRPFTLYSIRRVSHVYYVSLGMGVELGHERTCLECGTVYEAKDTTYSQISRKRLTLDELKQGTFPNVDAVYQDRLALEERIRNGRAKLSPADRFALNKEPFMYLSARVNRRFATTHIDKGVGIAIIAAILLAIGVVRVTADYFPESLPEAAMISVAVGVAAIIWQAIASGPRYMRREILPILARCLQPLHPTEQELEAVITELGYGPYKIARKLKAGQVFEQIHAGMGAIVPKAL
jgi:hypothetical protein